MSRHHPANGPRHTAEELGDLTGGVVSRRETQVVGLALEAIRDMARGEAVRRVPGLVSRMVTLQDRSGSGE